jgi:hypothetical protein
MLKRRDLGDVVGVVPVAAFHTSLVIVWHRSTRWRGGLSTAIGH